LFVSLFVSKPNIMHVMVMCAYYPLLEKENIKERKKRKKKQQS